MAFKIGKTLPSTHYRQAMYFHQGPLQTAANLWTLGVCAKARHMPGLKVTKGQLQPWKRHLDEATEPVARTLHVLTEVIHTKANPSHPRVTSGDCKSSGITALCGGL
jgi:hypothetical protein